LKWGHSEQVTRKEKIRLVIPMIETIDTGVCVCKALLSSHKPATTSINRQNHARSFRGRTPSLRRQKILLILERDGKVMASELSQHFAVSEDTIRRDLAELDSAGLVQRVHGGALPRPKDTGKDYFTRLEKPMRSKCVGAAAAQKVEDGQIVLFDSGSTTLQVARSLRADIQHHRGDRFADDGHRLV
jgi:DNA-binding Lrp family transcriptional regulator